MSENLFEYTVRSKLRFASARGELSAEQLWDVPLRSRDDFNLDAVARAANKAWKAVSEESFVETTRTPEHDRREAALAVVKRVIEVRVAEENAARDRAVKKVEKETLLRVLAEKQEGKMSALSEAELKKRIAALDL